MYQIEIYRQQYSQPVDMDAVRAAVKDLMTEDQGREDGHSESVYVQFGKVVEAVERINALGYETDEDANEEAAFHAEDTKYDEDNWQEFAAEQQAQRDRFDLDA